MESRRYTRATLISENQKKIKFDIFCAQEAPLPQEIQIEPTTKCNCRCMTCPRRFLNSKTLNRDLSTENFKKIIGSMHFLKKIHLQGLGEPLLCKNIKGILEYGASRKINFSTNSNGTIINIGNIDLILEHFQDFNISLDSVDKKNFGRIREGADLTEVLGNIKKLVARKNKIKSRTRISCSFVVTHLNYRELPVFFKLSKIFGFNAQVVECLDWGWPVASRMKQLKSAEFVKKSRRIRGVIESIIDQYKDKISIHFYEAFRGKNYCDFPFYFSYISVKGFVTPCCIMSDSRVFNFGNAIDRPFHEIWNSDKYRYFRKTMIFDLRNIFCDNCFSMYRTPDKHHGH